MGEHSAFRLTLFGHWRLVVDGQPVDVPSRSRRLLALLAVRGRQNRGRLAGTLWPEVDERRAQASLRAAVSVIGRLAPRLLGKDQSDVFVDQAAVIDLDEFRRGAVDVLAGRLADPALSFDDPGLIGGDLLPGWYDDWVFVERERIHQLRLHVLEALAQQFADRGAYGQALHVALEAVSVDPLRESARRSVVKVHLAEGNVVEAAREYDRFRALLRAELGVEPTRHLAELVGRVAVTSHA